MPTYQYRCQDCDSLHEVFQAFTDDALTECPSCRGSLRKLYNSVGVVFKGSGFYRTDSRDSAAAASTAATPSSDGAKPGTSTGTSDTTPAKTDTKSAPPSTNSTA